MNAINQIKFLLRISRSHDIVRRYFVVNGFDGALTMLGMMMGFLFSSTIELSVVINTCLAAAIALGMSGMSSAYVSEYAERQRTLGKLEEAMISDLHDSAHGDAARAIPVLIALVNGLAPFVISLLILIPLLLSNSGIILPLSPFYLAILIALLLLFFLGVFLGRVAGISWLRSGLQTLFVAMLTVLLIYLLVKK